MGNRKENKKKIIRTTQSWSSDDDDEVLPAPRTLQHSRRHPRTSVDDMPGTSGLNGGQQSSEETSPATARKNQAKMDRNFFWSIINNTQTPTENQTSRRTEDKVVHVKTVTIRPSEEEFGSLQARRLIDFKKLTRSLQNIEQSLSTDNTAQPTSSSSVPRVTTGSAPPLTRNAPSVSQANSSRNVTASFRPASNSARNSVPPGHAVPVFSRNVASTSQARHPYSRPAASSNYQTSHFHPGITTATNNGTSTQSRIATLAGHAPPPDPRNTANPPSFFPSWTTAATGHTDPPFAWAAGAANHGPPFPLCAAESRSQPDPNAIWNAAAAATNAMFNSVWEDSGNFISRNAMQPSQVIGAENNEEMRWKPVSIPAFPIRENLRRRNNQIQNPEPSNSGDTETAPQNIVPEPFQQVRITTAMMPQEEPAEEENVENPENPEEDAVMAEADLSEHNTHNTGLIEEEIVEVPAPNEEEHLEVPGTEADEASDEPTAENTTNVATVAAETRAEGNAQSAKEPSSHKGHKRKREVLEDSKETFTAQYFNKNLLRLLECPVCLEWVESPITQCRGGHLVCGRCRARLNACPVCRTPFSSVRNRAMEGVAEMLRYPCRHGCGREVRLRRRVLHESSCEARRYQCPVPTCARHPPLPREELAHHFQSKHMPVLKIGQHHRFKMQVNTEHNETFLIMAMDEYFYLRINVDVRTWVVAIYVSYIGPKKNASKFYYEVTVLGHNNSRKLVYTRTTHSDLESSSINLNRQDCFQLTLVQALNFIRVGKNYCPPDKVLDFNVELTRSENENDSLENST